jgi:hypothetical protein
MIGWRNNLSLVLEVVWNKDDDEEAIKADLKPTEPKRLRGSSGLAAGPAGG